MSKILILANDFTTIYHFRTELVKRLLEDKHKVFLSLPQDERNSVFTDMGCEVIDTPISRFGKNPLEDLKTQSFYKKTIKKIKPDMVFTYTAKPNIYGAVAAKNCGVRCACNVTGLGANFQSENIVKKIMLMLQKYAYKKADVVFFQNSENLNYFKEKGIVGDNARLLPGSGVNLEQNKYEECYRTDGKVKFVTIARIRQDKGYDELFEAIKKAHGDGLNAEFHILGWYEDDNYKQITEQMQNEYGVIVHGSVSHEKVHDTIKEFQFLIHPSYHEGMSNVILEAASSGLVCLASNISGCKEAVEDGKTGFLFEVRNSNSLYEAIKKAVSLSEEERKSMGIAAHEKMSNEFDRNIIVNNYLSLLGKKPEGEKEYVTV